MNLEEPDQAFSKEQSGLCLTVFSFLVHLS